MLGFKLPSTLERLLLCCLVTLPGITLGQEHGTGEKVSVKEGSDVVLPCSLSTKQDMTAAVFDWTKVSQKHERPKEVFFYDAGDQYNNGRDGQSEQFTGRVSHFEDQLKYANASIIIRNAKLEDTGNYTCVFPRLQPRQTFYIELVVEFSFKDRSGQSSGAAPEPYIRMLHATDVWSLLQCEVRRASPKPEVEWQDSDGNRLPAEEPQVSERGGSYNITLNITVKKTDHYRCVATQKTINHQIHAETFVFISGAAPEPYIRTLDATDVWSLLQCEVRGASPQPEVEWQDSDGNRLPAEEPQVSERGGSYNITLNITVKKTDLYRCVATQKTINHQIHAETFVFISVKDCKDWIGWLGGVVLGGFIVLTVLALLVFVKCITIRCNNSRRQQENGLDDQEEVTVHLKNGPVDEENNLVNREISKDPPGVLPQSAEAS